MNAAPIPGWVPWAVFGLVQIALITYWAWPRIANRKPRRKETL